MICMYQQPTVHCLYQGQEQRYLTVVFLARLRDSGILYLNLSPSLTDFKMHVKPCI